MGAQLKAWYHVHGQVQPEDAGKLITVKAVRSVWREPVGKRNNPVTFVGWLPYLAHRDPAHRIRSYEGACIGLACVNESLE